MPTPSPLERTLRAESWLGREERLFHAIRASDARFREAGVSVSDVGASLLDLFNCCEILVHQALYQDAAAQVRETFGADFDLSTIRLPGGAPCPFGCQPVAGDLAGEPTLLAAELLVIGWGRGNRAEPSRFVDEVTAYIDRSIPDPATRERARRRRDALARQGVTTITLLHPHLALRHRFLGGAAPRGLDVGWALAAHRNVRRFHAAFRARFGVEFAHFLRQAAGGAPSGLPAGLAAPAPTSTPAPTPVGISLLGR
ncbi:MAG: hypothetical protein HY719_05650 [Planctomycetes bacterium]|nr:hypothetical protein [Planctomycetota bacterium]